ncbi:MAG: hypothetical protein ACREOW_04935 [Thermodesulfobacteriota bacterium]
MKKAIVIGCHVNGLGVIRSLGLKQLQIIAMFYNQLIDFAHTSKYVHERVKIPHPRKEEKEFIGLLIQNSSKWKDALIIETNDDALIAISKNKDILENHYKILTPEWNILRKLIDKSETYRLAEECNVPHPKTFLPKTADDLHKIKNEIPYPCILKPVLGHVFFSEFNSKNLKVSNFSELLSKFEFCLKSGHEVMVQEIIPGPDSNIYQCAMYISSNGNIRAAFHTRKIRQNPPQFGVARVALGQEVIPQIKEFTERMLKEIDFRGMVHSEFKKDPRDNVFKLMEINGRLPRSNWLATHCGVNLPWIAYMDVTEKKQIKVEAYKKDVYWIELSKDLSMSIFRHHEENLGLKDYLEPYLSKNKSFADISREDLMPFFKRIAIFLMRPLHIFLKI